MRNLIIIFAIKLCIINLSCCDANPCNKKWRVILVTTEDEEHYRLNSIFTEELERFSDIISVTATDPSIVDNAGLTSILDLDLKGFGASDFTDYDADWKNQTVVVHLYVKDFYKHNYNDILKRNFIHAGDGALLRPITANKCSRKENTILQNECTKKQHECMKEEQPMLQENCQTTEIPHIAKVVSDTVFDFPALHEYINRFPRNNFLDQIKLCNSSMNIIVCGSYYPTNRNFYTPFYHLIHKIEIRNKQKCEELKIDPTTIAILAPKPFQTSEMIDTTTIFYDVHNTSPETLDMFNNYLPWIPLKTDKIKFALLKFMQKNNWNRVAIISDDSPTSKEFEQELTALFDKENVIYASRSCDVLNCDFTELLAPLIKVKAKLIIANIGEEHAMELTKQVNGMQLQTRLAWIFREWSTNAAKTVDNGIGDVFSMTLDFIDHVQLMQEDLLNTIRKYSERNVLHDDFIKNTVKLLTHPKTFHSEFANGFKNFIQKIHEDTRTKVIITRYSSPHSKISEIIISPSNEIISYYWQDDELSYIRTEVPECNFKSYHYMKLCNDQEIMLFVLVAAVFVLMIVGILYFFQSAEISYSRMSCRTK